MLMRWVLVSVWFNLSWNKYCLVVYFQSSKMAKSSIDEVSLDSKSSSDAWREPKSRTQIGEGEEVGVFSMQVSVSSWSSTSSLSSSGKAPILATNESFLQEELAGGVQLNRSISWDDRMRLGCRGDRDRIPSRATLVSHREGDLVWARTVRVVLLRIGLRVCSNAEACGLPGNLSFESVRLGLWGAKSFTLLDCCIFSRALQRIFRFALASVDALSITIVVLAESIPSWCTRKSCNAWLMVCCFGFVLLLLIMVDKFLGQKSTSGSQIVRHRIWTQ